MDLCISPSLTTPTHFRISRSTRGRADDRKSVLLSICLLQGRTEGRYAVSELVAGLAGVAATFAIYGVYYIFKERRRQRGAAPRQEHFSVTGAARIPLEYEDRPDRNLPIEATPLNGSFTLRIDGRSITTQRSTPALFGDSRNFWSCLLTDLRNDDLPRVEIDGDLYLLAGLSFPPNGRVLVRFLDADLAIIHQIEAVGGVRI